MKIPQYVLSSRIFSKNPLRREPEGQAGQISDVRHCGAEYTDRTCLRVAIEAPVTYPLTRNAALQRLILEVRSSLSQLRSNIAEYTKLGEPVPTRLKIRLMIPEERQAKLEARAAKSMNPPRFFDAGGYKVTSDSVNTNALTPQQQLESGGT